MGNFKNTISYNNTYILRNTTGNDKKNYYGYRDAINFISEYNFDLDNRIIFGLDNEFDKAELYNYYTQVHILKAMKQSIPNILIYS